MRGSVEIVMHEEDGAYIKKLMWCGKCFWMWDADLEEVLCPKCASDHTYEIERYEGDADAA